MSDRPQPDDAFTIADLRRALVRLFKDASAAEEPDHGACAKYASMLKELLPHVVAVDPSTAPLDGRNVDAIRRVVQGRGSAESTVKNGTG